MTQGAELPWSLQELDDNLFLSNFMNNYNEVCPVCKSSNVITDPESGCSKCGTALIAIITAVEAGE